MKQNAVLKKENAEQMIIKVMEKYGDALLRTCLLFLRDIHAAEDAVQETLIKAYKSYSGYLGSAQIKTWLIRIAVNTCKDLLRKRRHEFTDTAALLESIPFYDDTEGRLEADELIKVITELPEKYKEVIILYYYHEMNTKDIANALELPCSTVTSRLIRARAQLKGKIKVWR